MQKANVGIKAPNIQRWATWNQKLVSQGRKGERKLRRRKGKGKHGHNRGSYKVTKTEYKDDGKGHSRRKMTRKHTHC